MELEFMLDFDVFLGIIEVSLGCLVFIDSWTVIHENFTDDMSSMKSYFDVIGVIKRKICQSGQDGTHYGRRILDVFSFSVYLN